MARSSFLNSKFSFSPLLSGVLLGVLLISGCKMGWRALKYGKPGVEDFNLFEERPIHRSGEVSGLVAGHDIGILPIEDWGMGRWYKEGMTYQDFWRGTGTKAVVVLREDTIVYEYYDRKFEETSRFNSFSMSKPYVSMLTGIAIEEGCIQSIDESIYHYIPDLIDSSLCGVKIRNLLQMTSGIKTNKSNYNPWGVTSRLYYGDNLYELVAKLRPEHPPSTKWKYENINTQLMAMVLERATGRNLSEYLEEKIWGPLGMEADAGWSLHEDTGVEKAFCCLNARARDFARFGLLMKNKGNWKGKQLIPEHWMRFSTRLDTSEGSRQRYQNTFYLTAEEDDYYMEGLLGQFTYIAPSTNTVIVRLGNRINPNLPWYDIFRRISCLDKKPIPVTLKSKEMEELEGTWKFGVSNFGDSTMFGKKAMVSATRKGLKVETNFNKTWIATPSSDTTFFNEKYARKLEYGRDSTGQISKMSWARRGNKWNLIREE